MICRSKSGWLSIAFGLLFLVSATGCGGREYEVAEVEGVLLIKGKPGHKVHIEFLPEVGTKGPRSVADTDAEGRFTLRLIEGGGSSSPGAVVGMHRVTLSDIQLAASATGVGVPIRFGGDYTQSSTTPLREEVKAGKQTVRIEIP